MKDMRKRMAVLVLVVGLLFTACSDKPEVDSANAAEELALTMLQEELTDAGLSDAQKASMLQVYEELGGKPAQLTDLLYVDSESMLTALFDDFYILQFTFDGDNVEEVSCEYSTERHYYVFYTGGEMEKELSYYLTQADERTAIQATILTELQNYYPDASITESSKEYISYWHYDKYETIGEIEAQQGVVYYIAMAALDATFEDGTVKTLQVHINIKVEDENWTVRSLWFGVQNKGSGAIIETITVIEEMEDF